tara:strand:- start:509 stop:1429 length:921 start_codon:yes stop_codon:yes gene_type:complete
MIKQIISLTLIFGQCSILMAKLNFKGDTILKLTKEDKTINIDMKKEIILITYNDISSNSEKKLKAKGRFPNHLNNIKSIQLGEGNKARKYGFIGGAFNLLLLYSIGVFDGENESNSTQNQQKWTQPSPVVIFMNTVVTILLLSPTLLPAYYGLSVPNSYSEPMIINEDDWSISFSKDPIMLVNKNLLERKQTTNESNGNDEWWSLNGQKPIKIKIEYDEAPIPKSTIIPSYPKLARQAAIEGTILIDALIDDDGIVKAMIVNKGKPRSGLNKEAMKAIRKTKFKPAQKNKKSIRVWTRIPVDFSLN